MNPWNWERCSYAYSPTTFGQLPLLTADEVDAMWARFWEGLRDAQDELPARRH